MSYKIFAKLFIFIFIAFNIFAVSPVLAEERDNNKFGIHLAIPDESDLKKAADLVNGTGGKWGYVTLVIPEDDRNREKWQAVFDKMRELHLIPIIRLATKGENGSWKRPAKEEADGWASFLTSLQWVVKKRYVILFNETNHGQEWGGSVDAAGYGQIAKDFAEALKSKNNDYVVMLAGMDASAPSSQPVYQDEESYLKTVIDTITSKDFNRLFDGLASHSYPNPAFSGSANGSGRTSVRSYEWELGLLKSWGIKDLPVFITETGWDGNNVSRSSIADRYQSVFENVWLPDDRVKAVTPFVLNYQQPPFLGFSWAAVGNDDFYPQYYRIQGMQKVSGDPEIFDKGNIQFDFPQDLVVNSYYSFKVTVKNYGQAIWDVNDGYRLEIEGMDPSQYFITDLHSVKPFQNQDVSVYIKTGSKIEQKKIRVMLKTNKRSIVSSNEWMFNIVPLPSLRLKVNLYPKVVSEGTDFELQVFDEREQLVFKKKNVEVKKGAGIVDEVTNIALGRKYRVVLLKQYYLPRQTFVTFKKGENDIAFERMYPVDFNADGKFDFSDIVTGILNPDKISLYFP